MSTKTPKLDYGVLMQLYLAGEYNKILDSFLTAFTELSKFSYPSLTNTLRKKLNIFVEQFLFFFCSPDIELDSRYAERFIALNATISNVVSMTDFETTDLHLSLLRDRTGHQRLSHLAKMLTLFSARNRSDLDRSVFFDIDAKLASRWWMHFFDLYSTALVNDFGYAQLNRHLELLDERLSFEGNLNRVYFGGTADLIEARNRAQAEARARATLFSTVSHDLQTPLYAAVSELRAASADGHEQSAEHVRLASLQLADLHQRIAAMVELAGSDGQDLVMRPRVVNLGRALTDVVEAHGRTQPSEDSPPTVIIEASARHQVLVDLERFQRIAHNLLAARLVENLTGSLLVRLEIHAAWAVLSLTGAVPATQGTTLALTRQLAEAAGGHLEVDDRKAARSS